MNINQTFQVNESVQFTEAGDFLRLLYCPYPVTVIFYKGGAEVSRAEEVTGGYAEQFEAGSFDRVRIVNGATNIQTVKAVIRGGTRVSYDAPPAGNVVVTNTGGNFDQATIAVGAASVNIAWAVPGRRYLLVENKSATQTVYVNLSNDATSANGITLLPGESLEISGGYCHTGEVKAIASAAGGSVVVLQGF